MNMNGILLTTFNQSGTACADALGQSGAQQDVDLPTNRPSQKTSADAIDNDNGMVPALKEGVDSFRKHIALC